MKLDNYKAVKYCTIIPESATADKPQISEELDKIQKIIPKLTSKIGPAVTLIGSNCQVKVIRVLF